MKYVMLMYADESKAPKTPEEQQAVAQDWYALIKEVEAAGVLMSYNGLSPSPTRRRCGCGRARR